MNTNASSATSEMQEADKTVTVNNSGTSGETPETPTQQQQTYQSIADAEKDIQELKAALKRANSEAASHRHKAKELDDLKSKLEADKLTETEKLQKRLSELQNQYDTATRQSQEQIIKYSVRLSAAKLGVVDPDDAAKLLDWSELDYDESGNPTNVDKLLKKLVEAKPWMLQQQKQVANVGATNPSRSQSSTSPLSWAVISAMTRDEYERRRPEIQQWMNANPPRF